MGIKIYKNDALIKEPTIYHLPQLINLKCQCEDTLLNANCIPIKAGTGSRHTILIMNCGSVYVAGWNVHGQIGSKEINSYCDVFKYVYKVNSSNIEDIEIACGNWCTLIGILWKITCYVCIMKVYERIRCTNKKYFTEYLLITAIWPNKNRYFLSFTYQLLNE